MMTLSQAENIYGQNIGDTVLFNDFPLDYACEICFYGSILEKHASIELRPQLIKDTTDFSEACSKYEDICFNENLQEKDLEEIVYRIDRVIFLYRLKRGMMNPLFKRPSLYYIFEIMMEYKIFHASYINRDVTVRKEFKCSY